MLQPVAPSRVMSEIMASKKPVVWETMIGNLKKWKDGEALQGTVTVANKQVVLTARLLNRELNQVEFSWSEEEIAFVDLVEACW